MIKKLFSFKTAAKTILFLLFAISAISALDNLTACKQISTSILQIQYVDGYQIAVLTDGQTWFGYIDIQTDAGKTMLSVIKKMRVFGSDILVWQQSDLNSLSVRKLQLGNSVITVTAMKIVAVQTW
jgi:uncharacterized cupredoxin-like copper-binding protein